MYDIAPHINNVKDFPKTNLKFQFLGENRNWGKKGKYMKILLKIGTLYTRHFNDHNHACEFNFFIPKVTRTLHNHACKSNYFIHEVTTTLCFTYSLEHVFEHWSNITTLTIIAHKRNSFKNFEITIGPINIPR
jgi:hypothetical protein